MSIPPAATLLQEIVIDASTGRDAAEVDQSETMMTVAQTSAVVEKDNQRSEKEAVPSLNQSAVTCDGIDEELSANLTDLMRLGQKARRNSVAEPSTRSSSLRNLTSTTGIGRASSSASLQDLSTFLGSLNAAEQEGSSTSRRSSLVQQGRRPSLRRRHSICYYSVPSSSGEEEFSSSSINTNANRRATLSTCDRRESLSSIITEVHPFSVGVDWLSDSDDSDSDDDDREATD